MDIVQDIIDGKLNANDGLLQTLSNEFFFAEENNMNIFKIATEYHMNGNKELLNELPLFFKIFLYDFASFEKFLAALAIVINNTDDPNIDVDIDINIISLMCCAMFNFAKLYIFVNGMHDESMGKIREYYAVFGDWLYDIIVNSKGIFDFTNTKLNSNNIYSPYTYLLLMSFVSKGQDFPDRPIFKFIKAIKERNLNLKINPVKDILQIFVYNDINQYSFHDIYGMKIYTLLTYDAASTAIVQNNEEIVNIDNFYVNHIIHNVFNGLCNIKPFLMIPQSNQEAFKSQVFMNCYRALQKDAKKIQMMLFCNAFVFNYLYDVKISTKTIDLNTEKWFAFKTIIWYLIRNSDFLQRDMDLIFVSINNNFPHHFVFDKEHFIHNGEDILFPIVKNEHFAVNADYIRKILKGVLQRDFKAKEFKNIAYSLKIIFGNLKIDVNNKDILVYLLEKLFSPKNLESSFPQFEFNENTFDDDTIHSQSFEKDSNANEQINNLPLFFKDILKNLLKNNIKNYKSWLYTNIDKTQINSHNIVSQILHNIYAYKNDLLHIGINLDDYKIYDLMDISPRSEMLNEARSANNVSPYKISDSEQLSFSSGQDIGYDLQQFWKKDLMKKLIAIYTKTIQPDITHIDTQKDDFMRIFKITQYIKRKYNRTEKLYCTIDNVVHGKELETLYKVYQGWIQRGQDKTLNRIYKITYLDKHTNTQEEGIDAGGLTKQFFTQIAAQIQDKFFVLQEDSTRYVLHTNNIIIDNQQLHLILQDEAFFVGQLLAMFIIMEIHIPFDISYVYLAHIMYASEHLSAEELFLYYLLDLKDIDREHYTKKYCINEPVEDNPELDYCNPKLILDTIVERYAYDQPFFQELTNGFFIEKKLFYSKMKSINDRVRIMDIDKILSVKKLTKGMIKKYIFDRIKIIHNGKIITLENAEKMNTYTLFKSLLMIHKKNIFKQLYANSSINEPSKSDFENYLVFKKALLVFWTGVAGVTSDKYYINITDALNNAYPTGHTCANELRLPSNIKSLQQLYDIFMYIFVNKLHINFNTA